MQPSTTAPPVATAIRRRRRLLLSALALTTAFVSAAGAAYGFFGASATGSASSLAQTLAAPGTGTVGTAGAVSLPLTWADAANLPSTGGSPDGYQVFRSTTGGTQGSLVPNSSGCYGTSQTVGQAAVSTTCTDSGLTPNTTYYYEVQSVYDNWVSLPGTQFSGTTVKQATTTTLSGISPTSGSSTTSFGATATVAGASGFGTPAGTVVFGLFTSSTCSGAASYTSSSVTLASGAATGSLSPSAAGTYYWGATYTPTDTFNQSSTGCNSATPITVSNTPTFGATDKGNGAATCTSFSTTHKCTLSNLGPITGGSAELVFVYLTGSNSTSTSVAAGGVSGPFAASPAPSSVNSVEFPTSTAKNYLFAYKATGVTTASGGSVSVTFDSGTTTEGSVVIDVVELDPGVTVSSTTAAGAGSNANGSHNVPVALAGAASADSELVFLGTADTTFFTAPSPPNGWAGLSGASQMWSTFDNPTAQTSATFIENASNKGWGYVAVQVNP